MLICGRFIFERFSINDERVWLLPHDRRVNEKSPKRNRGIGIFNILIVVKVIIVDVFLKITI